MTIACDQIKPGLVAILDPDVLLYDKRVRKQRQESFRHGPFLCVHAEGGESVWFALTTQFKPKRLELRKAWLLDGSPRWRSIEQYLTDARNPYVGSNEAFVDASWREVDFDARHRRPRMSMEGVRAVIAETMKYAEKAVEIRE